MKKTIIILALIVIGMNITSCTQDRILEDDQTQIIKTTGDTGQVEEERDDG